MNQFRKLCKPSLYARDRKLLPFSLKEVCGVLTKLAAGEENMKLRGGEGGESENESEEHGEKY